MNYLISQIITAIWYIILASTYQVKNRKTVLFLNCFGKFMFFLVYAFLKAWSALAMCVVGLIRNIIFMIDEKKNGKRENINKLDNIVLVSTIIVSIFLSIPTYEGIWSLVPIISTILYTYTLCQKNMKIYKMFGIPMETLYLCYNIYLRSILGIIGEIVILISSIIGYIREIKNNGVRE